MAGGLTSSPVSIKTLPNQQEKSAKVSRHLAPARVNAHKSRIPIFPTFHYVTFRAKRVIPLSFSALAVATYAHSVVVPGVIIFL